MWRTGIGTAVAVLTLAAAAVEAAHGMPQQWRGKELKEKQREAEEVAVGAFKWAHD